ncbi:MAG: Guanosine-3',5'-bis(diphosphate) 3'-pyrophosphohydrolase / GTP pyrophosphokinase, (p)ppGpp synthetase II, partial [uncultured Quadrisphaera sp.]
PARGRRHRRGRHPGDRARRPARALRPARRPPGHLAGHRAAGRDRAEQPPQGRHLDPGAGVRRRREGPPRAAAQERRPVHHPPRGGGDDPRRAGHDAAHPGGRAAARHRRGHRLLPGHPAQPVRRRGGDAGRRGDQARQGRLRRGRPGRDGAQDGRRDGQGHPRAGDQALRPAAQRPHLAVRLGRLRGEEGPRDPGDLRPPGAPAGDEHHQVGAGGPLLRHPVPRHAPGGRAPGRRARPGPRGVPGRGARPGQRRPAGREDQGPGHRAAQALLLRVPEDDRARPRLHRHLRPGRAARAGRLGARLLRRPRRPARPVEPGAGAVQGLHRDAQVQHVPVAAHHRDRARGQARRDPDPHPRDAPPRGVRRRGALEVQGRHRARRGRRRRGRRRLGRRRRHVVAAPARRLAAGDPGPGRVPRVAALRDQRAGGVRLHPQGRGHRPARRVDADRLRLRGAHRGRPPRHGRAGQRAADPAGVDPRQRRRRRDLHLPGGDRGPQPRLADVRQEPPGPQQDPRLVLQGAPRGGDRQGQGRHRQGDAQAAPADPAPDVPRGDGRAGHRDAARRRLRAVRGGGGEPRLRAVGGRAPGGLARRRGGRAGGPRRGHPAHPGDPPAPQRRPGGHRQGRRRRVGQARAVLHPGAGRPDHGLRHPRPGRLGAPRGLRQRRGAARPAGADRRGGVGVELLGAVPGADPGGGARPVAAALGRDPGALRPPRQHPVGVGDHLPRPRGGQPLHLRDGRPRAPRRRGGRGAPGRRGLRRLPDDGQAHRRAGL